MDMELVVVMAIGTRDSCFIRGIADGTLESIDLAFFLFFFASY